MKCVNCNTPNPERWFYCKSCGNRASEPIYTTNLFMMSEGAKRSDVEFSVKIWMSIQQVLLQIRKKDKIKFGKKELNKRELINGYV